MTTASAISPFADILPTMVTIPGPRMALEPLGAVLFAVHILLVNIILGLSAIALVQSFRGKSAFYSTLMPKTLALAVNLGVACLLFVQVLFNSFSYPSYILMGLIWFGLPFIVLMAYYGLYIFDSNHDKEGCLGKPVLLISVFLLLCSAYILTLNNTIMSRPDKWLEAYQAHPGGAIWSIGIVSLLPRFLHNVVASLAIGGLALAWLAFRKNKNTGVMPAEYALGLKWFMFGTMVQAAVGVWYLFSQEQPVTDALLGGKALGTGLVALGAAAGISAIYAAHRQKLGLTTALALSAVSIMVALRYFVRHLLTDPVAMPDMEAKLVGPALLFIVCIIVVAALVVWIFKAAAPALRSSGGSAEGRDAR